MFPGMAGPLHDLTQLTGKADLGVACRDCRHGETIDIDRIVRRFVARTWSTGWRAAHARFRCSVCGSKAVVLTPNFHSWGQRHPIERRPPAATLRPGLRPPPPGVSIAAWNAADERERKRLVDRSRG